MIKERKEHTEAILKLQDGTFAYIMSHLKKATYVWLSQSFMSMHPELQNIWFTGCNGILVSSAPSALQMPKKRLTESKTLLLRLLSLMVKRKKSRQAN